MRSAQRPRGPSGALDGNDFVPAGPHLPPVQLWRGRLSVLPLISHVKKMFVLVFRFFLILGFLFVSVAQ